MSVKHEIKTLTEQYLDFLNLPKWTNIYNAMKQIVVNAPAPVNITTPVIGYFESVVRLLIRAGLLTENSEIEVLTNWRDGLVLDVREWYGEDYVNVRVRVEPDTSVILYEYNFSDELVDEEYIEEEGDSVDKRLNELLNLEYDPRLVKKVEKDWLKVEVFDSAVCYTCHINFDHTHCYPTRLYRLRLPTPKLWDILGALPTVIEILELLLLD